MSQIHNVRENKFRMPLFLQPEQARKWIDPALTDEEINNILNYEIPSEELEYHTVYTIRSNKARGDGKPKSEPFEWPNLRPLGIDVIEEPKLF